MTRHALCALLALVLSCRARETPVPAGMAYPGAPVIIISIDTLRADHLPAYGYRGVATPAIDALRADGILYRNAWSHCPMTLPSHISMLTGLLPYEHGVRNNIGYRFDASRHDSIPAMLRRSGYATGAAVSAYVMRGDTGLGSLFDFYDDQTSGQENVAAGSLSRDGDKTVTAAEAWINANAAKPFFFLLHLFEPHAPYEAPEPFRSQAAHPYDAEIAAADALVGRFIQQLEASGAYDRAIVILLSDHGEGLGDHGEGEHGVFLYREALHVPLIVKLPSAERAGTTVDEPVQLIDLAPTIAALTQTKLNAPVAGLAITGDVPADRRIYSETLLPRIHFGWSELRSIAGARHHFIEAPRSELYDYVADPREITNLVAAERRVSAALKNELEKFDTSFAEPSAADAEEAAKLAALGYIGQVRSTAGRSLPDPKDAIGQLEELRKAAAVETNGELRAAALLYEDLARRHPGLADAWLRLATLRERFGDRDAAIVAYRHAVNAAPDLAAHLAVRIGSLYLLAGRLDQAAAHADLAVKSSPGAAHHLLGRVALARGDFRAAEREARAAAAHTEYRNPAAVLQALILVEQGKLPEALQLLDGERARNVGSSPVRDLELTRADVLARMERMSEAVTAFEAEIAAFPQNRAAYLKLALVHFATGRGDLGASTLERMYAASPDRSSALMAAEAAEAVGESELAGRWKSRGRS